MTTPSRAARLRAQDWVDAALRAIVDGGLAAVSVEPLARALGATKGSFYWHFTNREALVEAALRAWEDGETRVVADLLAPLPDAAARLRLLLGGALRDRLGARVEAGLLADAEDSRVQAVLERATRTRTGYLQALFTELGVPAPDHRATTAFAIYLGLLHLRRTGSGSVPQGAELDRYVQLVCEWLIEGATSGAATRGRT